MEKQALIFLHGALGSVSQFQQAAALLSDQYDIYGLDFSGHGGRDVPDSISIEGFTAELNAFLNAQDLHNVYIFGYSMGGYVALNLARTDSSRIQRILTLGTKFDWNPVSAAKEAANLNPDIIEEKVPRFAQMLSDRHGATNWKHLLNRTASMMLDLGNGSAFSPDQLNSIGVKVRIAIGELDNMVTQDESRLYANAIKGADLVVVHAMKHPIEQAAPEVLRDLILTFAAQ